MKARALVLSLAGLAVILVGGMTFNRGRGHVSCPEAPGASLYVDTGAHVLLACREGRAEERFVVRLGSGGVGKKREGDKKSPLGTYALSPSRPSARFGTFVPIGYPTAEQAAAGFTGSAVGVHGPHRALRFAGRLTNALDTTDGCVGLATDEEMERLARWLHAHADATITLR